MLRKFGSHLRDQWMGAVALFLVLGGGTAYAVTQIDANSVKSKHIVNDQVKSVDVRDDSLAGGGLTGADIDESSLDLAQARSGVNSQGVNFGCYDNDQDGEICAQTFMTLTRTSDVFVAAATSAWTQQFNDGVGPDSATDAPNLTEGRCTIVLDGVDVPGLHRSSYEIQAAPDAQSSGRIGLAITGVLDSVPAGSHQFGLRCTETDGDVSYLDNQISAVVIGDN